jgi:hypothetical protein
LNYCIENIIKAGLVKKFRNIISQLAAILCYHKRSEAASGSDPESDRMGGGPATSLRRLSA